MSNVLPSPASGGPMVELIDIHKSYRMGQERLEVLKGVSLSVRTGEYVALMGASGSGKSTLLHIAGALDRPDMGRVLFQGQSVPDMWPGDRHRLRNNACGFVFQFYHLLPELNVLENVLLPAMVAAPLWMGLIRARPRKAEALELLDQLGLTERLKHRPAQLSGGERQRAAIARALINQPALLLADEPTGNLDMATGKKIMDVLLRRHRAGGQTILLVTHDPNIAAEADRVVHIADGRIVNGSK